MVGYGRPFILTRALKKAVLVSLACILVLTGGSDGSTVYPKYLINVILTVLVGLGWLTWFLWRRRPFPSTPFDLPLLSWITALLIATIASSNPRRGLETFVYYLVCVLIFYLMVALERAGKSLENWITAMLSAGFLVFVFGYLELGFWYRTWLDIGGPEQLIPPATIRVQSTLGWYNYLAAFLNLLLPLVAVRLISSPTRKQKALWAIWCGAALVLIYLTSSRGGWLGTVTALGTLALLIVVDQWKKVQEAGKWLLRRPILIGGVLLASLILSGIVGILLLRQVQHPSHSISDPRGYMWSVAWAMFRSRPLIGTGPSTFASGFMRSYSIPPNTLMPHAHNFLINLLGESGILGAGTGLWLGLALAWIAFRRWKAESPGKRTLLAGALAAMAGLAAHSQFDVVQLTPAVNLVAATILAQLAAPFESTGRVRQVAGSMLLIASWVAVSGVWIWAMWGYSLFQQGLEAANKKDWETASYWVDKAVERDPNLAFYHYQSGQIHAQLALDGDHHISNQSELTLALDEFERGLRIDDAYSMDWASVGVLRWIRGDRIGGIDALERANSLAPFSADINVTLGQMYEENGQMDRALELYRKALELQPEFAKSAYFRQSTLRREAMATFNRPLLDPGWQALEAGDYTRAEELFRAQVGLNTEPAYFGLGLSLLNQCDWFNAERALRTADFIVGDNREVKEALAKLYDATGREELASSVRGAAKNLNPLEDTQINYGASYHRFGLRSNFPIELSH